MQITSLNGAAMSGLTFGTMQFGGTADKAQSQAMYDAARAAGITHFDTAHAYTDGRSESYLGEFIQQERESLIIATKAGYTGGAGRANLTAQFDLSRQRLGLDCVDILYLHRFDEGTDLRETFETFAEMQSRGQLRYVGLSNFAAWQVVKAQWVASELETQVDILQPMYSLVKRQVEVELLPMCADQGIEVAPYSPLGGGLLTGKYAAGGTGRLTEDERYAARYGQGWMHEAADGLSRLAEERGVSPATLAVAWVMAHPVQPRPIISARSVEQLAPSLAAASFEVDAELYAALSALTPRPAPATDRLEEQV